MGYYKLQRPAWNPRGQEIKYVVDGRVLTRGWPERYRDAKSASQLNQRAKVNRLSKILPNFKTLFALGYAKGIKPNGRCVGSYQRAYGQAVKTCFSRDVNGPTLHLERLELTEGGAQLPTDMRVEIMGSTIKIYWVRWHYENERIALFAARRKDNGTCFSKIIHFHASAMGFSVELPSDWASKEMETWTAFLRPNGNQKTKTHYQVVS